MGGLYRKYQCTPGSVIEADSPISIKSELYLNGPLSAAMTVYEDFLNYKSGIYHHVAGSKMGSLGVKILGWGIDHSQEKTLNQTISYWIVGNSWGSSWGEAGTFKIAEGEADIDKAAYGCTPFLLP